jgi:hypothetical protein
MFIASRFFVGTASGFLGCVPILVTEVAYPTALYKQVTICSYGRSVLIWIIVLCIMLFHLLQHW